MTPRRRHAVEAVIDAAREVVECYPEMLVARLDGVRDALAEMDACLAAESLSVGTPTSGEVVDLAEYWADTTGWNAVVEVRFYLPSAEVVALRGEASVCGGSRGSLALSVDGAVRPESEARSGGVWTHEWERVSFAAGWHVVKVMGRGKVRVKGRVVRWEVSESPMSALRKHAPILAAAADDVRRRADENARRLWFGEEEG